MRNSIKITKQHNISKSRKAHPQKTHALNQFSPTDIKNRLQKYKITPERYASELNLLLHLKNARGEFAYTTSQANALILKPHSKNNVKAILDFHFILMDFGYQPVDIYQIVNHSGGYNNAKTIVDLLQDLKNTNQSLTDLHPEFTFDALRRMASHAGGSHNIQVVLNVLQQLKANNEQLTTLHPNFTFDALRSMASNDGGSHNIQAVLNVLRQLKANDEHLTTLHPDFTFDTLRSMASHNGGSHNIQAVLNVLRQLKANNEQLTTLHPDFTFDALKRMASRDGGSHNIQAVLNILHQLKVNNEQLTTLHPDFTFDALRLMVSHIGGSLNIQAVLDILRQLKANDEQLTTLHPDFTFDALKNIVSHDGGTNNIQTVLSILKQLKSKNEQLTTLHPNFTFDALSIMVSKSGGANNIKAVLNVLVQLKANNEQLTTLHPDFTFDALKNIASHNGGSHNIQAVLELLRQLKANDEQLTTLHPDFTFDALRSIASHTGGSHSLKVILDNLTTLTGKEEHQCGLTINQITILADRTGASSDIKNMIKEECQDIAKKLQLPCYLVSKIEWLKKCNKNAFEFLQSNQVQDLIGLKYSFSYIVQSLIDEQLDNLIAIVRSKTPYNHGVIQSNLAQEADINTFSSTLTNEHDLSLLFAELAEFFSEDSLSIPVQLVESVEESSFCLTTHSSLKYTATDASLTQLSNRKRLLQTSESSSLLQNQCDKHTDFAVVSEINYADYAASLASEDTRNQSLCDLIDQLNDYETVSPHVQYSMFDDVALSNQSNSKKICIDIRDSYELEADPARQVKPQL